MAEIIQMEYVKEELLTKKDKGHRTELGVERIVRNMELGKDIDVVKWCVGIIHSPEATVTRRGKNYYIDNGTCVITVNAYSYTVITVHKVKMH